MEAWALHPTYALIANRFGSTQLKRARESIRSVLDRQEFARYHYSEVVRLIRQYERRHLKGQLLVELPAAGSSRREAFEIFIVKAGAHATATVQNLHAIPDVLAYALHFATGSNLHTPVLPERKISVNAVHDRLQKDVKFGSLAPLLRATQDGATWTHVAALSNLGKHRALIRTSLNEDWTGKRADRLEVQFSACEYNGTRFRPIALRALVQPTFDHLVDSVLRVGHELTKCLEAA